MTSRGGDRTNREGGALLLVCISPLPLLLVMGTAARGEKRGERGRGKGERSDELDE